MELLLDLLSIVSIVVIALGLPAWITVIRIKNRIERNKALLASENIYPDGSDICHGMVMTSNGIESDEKETMSWYSKLAQ
jgi:hypothetical protein